MVRGPRPGYLFLLPAVFLLTAFVSCAVKPERAAITRPAATAYLPSAEEGGLVRRFAPVFIAEETFNSFNRIGTAAAEYRGGKERVYVDPSRASVYVRRQPFSTESHHYTNLIYRIHFPEVPCSLFSFHLTCGRNGGLLIYLTLDERERPVLVTTLHTCGCYLAFVPTDYLPETSFPEGWNTEKQEVYGEILPGRISFSRVPEESGERLIIRLRKETHRVMEVRVGGLEEIRRDFQVETYRQLPAEALLELSAGKGSTSFFEEDGPGKGYVKQSSKPYERLLMSWWTLDWYIGQDKRLGSPEESGVVFYTSLKFWDREESNIWYFDRFLEYWDWDL